MKVWMSFVLPIGRPRLQPQSGRSVPSFVGFVVIKGESSLWLHQREKREVFKRFSKGLRCLGPRLSRFTRA